MEFLDDVMRSWRYAKSAIQQASLVPRRDVADQAPAAEVPPPELRPAAMPGTPAKLQPATVCRSQSNAVLNSGAS